MTVIGEMHHIAVGVLDMKRALDFYIGVLGMELDYKAHHEGEAPSRISGVPGAVLDVCVVKKGRMRVELVDYKDKAEPGLGRRRQNDMGFVHVTFLVVDIDTEYERIRSLGYEFFSPPLEGRPNGPKVCYFYGPDNVVVELYEPVRR
jgi:catechol 2,3-dioxygenase-like lactoylglutathione lyase family enzyme